MKKVLVGLAIVSMTGWVFAQGTVILNNRITPELFAPVYGPDPINITLALTGQSPEGIPAGTTVYGGPLLTGSGYRAMLFSAPVANPTDLRVAVDTAGQPLVTTFRTGAAAGAMAMRTVTLQNVPMDAPAGIIQIRAWDNRSGLYPTWTEAAPAWLGGLIAAGMSKTWQLNNIGGSLNLPPPLYGMESFNIYFIPEPGALALVGLTLAAMIIMRRRK